MGTAVEGTLPAALPGDILFCCIRVFSINGSAVNVVIMAVFGLFGYVMCKFGFEPAPLILGFVLGRMMEEALRQAMIIYGGDVTTFFTRPISGALLFFAAIMLLFVAMPAMRRPREEIFVE